MKNYEKTGFICVVTLLSIFAACGFITAQSIDDVLVVPTLFLFLSFIPVLLETNMTAELASAPMVALGGVCVGIALVGGAVGAVAGVLISMAVAIYFVVEA